MCDGRAPVSKAGGKGFDSSFLCQTKERSMLVTFVFVIVALLGIPLIHYMSPEAWEHQVTVVWVGLMMVVGIEFRFLKSRH